MNKRPYTILAIIFITLFTCYGMSCIAATTTDDITPGPNKTITPIKDVDTAPSTNKTNDTSKPTTADQTKAPPKLNIPTSIKAKDKPAKNNVPEPNKLTFITPKDKDLIIANKKTAIQKTFGHSTDRLQYFLQETTNFIDVPSSSPYFYDYINPDMPEDLFIQSTINIYEKILLLKDIEKSKKERDAIYDIHRFLATNHKTQYIPAETYLKNSHLPAPLYRAQLINLAQDVIKNHDVGALHALIDNYDLVNERDKSGNTPLFYAIKFHRNDMVKYLMSKGANINSSNNSGSTPLMIAAKNNNAQAARFLLNKGSNVKKLDSSGNSALDYASSNSNPSMYRNIFSNTKR